MTFVDNLTVLPALDSSMCGGATSQVVDGRLSGSGSHDSVVRQVPVYSLESVVCALHAIEHDPQSLIIRGEPKVRETRIWPGTLTEKFAPASRQWCLLELPDIEIPHEYRSVRKYTIEALLITLELLPDEFQDSHFWYCFLPSSSDSDSDRINLRLWYWLDRKVSDQEMKAWLKDSPVDLRLFHPLHMISIKPHTVEAKGGDRFSDRSGFFRAGRRASVPVPPELDLGNGRMGRMTG